MTDTVYEYSKIKIIPKTEKIQKEVEENGNIMVLLGYDHEGILVRCKAFVGWIKNHEADWEYNEDQASEV